MKITNNRIKQFFFGLWEYLKKAKVEFFIILFAVAFDLGTKTLIDKNMQVDQTVVVIPDFLNWYYTFNDRAGFGWAFGLENKLTSQQIMTIFIVLTFAALVLFFFLLYKFRDKRFLARLSLSFIIGGAIGNLIDRMAFGYVRDFIQIVYFGLDLGLLGTSFAVFNIADSFLTVGVILFAVYIIFFFDEGNKQKEEKKKSVREMTTAELNGIKTDESEENFERGENSEESDNCRDR